MIEWTLRKDIGGRNEQQDNGCTLVDDSSQICLAAVADGLGGHSGGKRASFLVVDTLKKIFTKTKYPVSQPALWLKQLCLYINNRILKDTESKGADPMTTIVLLFIQDKQAYCLHVGDSRLYFFQQGKFISRTKDHSYIQKLLDQGVIQEDKMATHPQQNIILKCLGTHQELEPELWTTSLQSNDAFLLCTDGFWEQINTTQMQNLVTSDDLRQDATKLLNLAIKKGGIRGDNICFAAVRYR